MNQTQTTLTGMTTCQYIIWKANKIKMLQEQYPDWTSQEIESVIDKLEKLRDMARTEHHDWNQKQVAEYTDLLEKSLLTILSADKNFSENMLKTIFSDSVKENTMKKNTEKDNTTNKEEDKTGEESALRDVVVSLGGESLLQDVVVQFAYQFGKKYGFSTTDRICYKGHNLRRIVALTDFADVKKGDVGGYVESEANLTQDGESWIYDDAIVMDDAVVDQDAQVRGKAVVDKKAKISGHAVVKDSGHVTDEAIVEQNAQVSGNAMIGKCAMIHGHAIVKDFACVTGKISIRDHAIVEKYAKVCTNCNWRTNIYDYAKITDHVQILRSCDVFGRAVLKGFAKITRTGARIYDDAEIAGHVVISGPIAICGHAQVYGHVTIDLKKSYGRELSRIEGYAKVHGHATIINVAKTSKEPEVWIKDHAEVFDYATIYSSDVKGNAKVFGHAEICYGATVDENAKVYGNAKVSGYYVKIGGHASVFDNTFIGSEYFWDRPYGEIGLIVNENAVLAGETRVTRTEISFKNEKSHKITKDDENYSCIMEAIKKMEQFGNAEMKDYCIYDDLSKDIVYAVFFDSEGVCENYTVFGNLCDYQCI